MNSPIIISSLVSEDIQNELEILGISYIAGGKSKNIQGETAYHPDMLFYPLLDGKILTEKGYVNNSDTNLEFYEGETSLANNYPFDCRFNCFTAGNNLICGKNVAKEIKDDAIMHGYNVQYVKQGYAACSTVRLYNDAFISSDVSIYKSLTKLGFDALLVDNADIKLNGYNCGFIGGCALYSDKDILAFSGNVKKHKDFDFINSFCANYKISIYSLSNTDLYDYGGFIKKR